MRTISLPCQLCLYGTRACSTSNGFKLRVDKHKNLNDDSSGKLVVDLLVDIKDHHERIQGAHRWYSADEVCAYTNICTSSSVPAMPSFFLASPRISSSDGVLATVPPYPVHPGLMVPCGLKYLLSCIRSSRQVP